METIIDVGWVHTKLTLPFRYGVLNPALPWDLYERLLKERLDWRKIAGNTEQANVRVDISYRDVAKGKYELTPLWRDFLDTHVTKRFHDQVCRFLDISPFEEDHQFIPRGVRSKNSLPRVNLDCQIGINTPNTKAPNRVRGPHVDFPGQLWGGMFYMPVEGDQACGDLIIYRSKVPLEQLRFRKKAELNDDFVEEVNRICYQPNVAVFFENGLHAIHGVSERKTTDLPRQLVNFLAETSVQQFKLQR